MINHGGSDPAHHRPDKIGEPPAGSVVEALKVLAQPPVTGDRRQTEQSAAGSVGAETLDVEDGAVALGTL